MIHFCVVHWQNARWIGRQLRHIAAYTDAAYRIVCFHTDLDGPLPQDGHIGFCEETRIREHATKLDILGHEACRQAGSDEDILVFIDSDAFPVAPWEAACLPLLPRHGLVAVQRLENLGDCQPHPCFCVTTVGFWRGIGGTWASGHKWHRSDGTKASDVGGNLRKHLDRAGVDWRPLHRSNVHDPHPLWFGLYGDIVYHHGAGSRGRLSHFDRDRIARRIRQDHPLRSATEDLLLRLAGRGRLVRLRAALAPQDRHRALLDAEEARLTALSARIEAAADAGLLSPATLDAILRDGMSPLPPGRTGRAAQDQKT
jgi:hypothetical protein